MIPEATLLQGNPTLVMQPSRTYMFNVAKGTMSGMGDGLAAMRQAVFKVLQSERFAHVIYSFDYGHELSNLIGTSNVFLTSEITRLLTEALMTDERVTAVSRVEVSSSGDSMRVRCIVTTLFGDLNIETEVAV